MGSYCAGLAEYEVTGMPMVKSTDTGKGRVDYVCAATMANSSP